MDKQKIISEIESNKKNLKKFNVQKIGLFGSYLKGKQTRNSDIDIVVDFKKIDADNYFNLWSYLENLFKNKKIDLVIESGLKPEVKYIKEEAEYVKV